jgi:tetratricopeptide (TPR) repeat protein
MSVGRHEHHSTQGSTAWPQALLMVALLLAYSNSFQGEFIFDDKFAILENEDIRRLWPLLPAIYPRDAGLTTAGRPVVCLSLAANYAISGTDVWSYHVFNLLVHLLATLALFGVVRRTLWLPKLRARFQQRSIGLALAAALIWGLHPLQTESVTYIVQRAESLVGLFFLLTLYCVIRGELSTNPRRWFMLAIFCCALGMASKEVMVTAPLMVLLYQRVFVFDSWRDVFRVRRGLCAGLISTWLLLAAVIVPLGGRGDSAGLDSGVGPLEYLQTQFVAIVTYLKLVLFPSPLILDYGRGLAREPREFVPFAMIVFALAGGTLMAFRYQPWSGYLGAWFFVTLAPSSSIVPIATQTIAEHRVYLALAGPIVLLVVAADLLSNRIEWGRPARAVLLTGVALLLGLLTWGRNEDYRTALSIWSDTIRKLPSNARAHSNLAEALRDAGDPSAALNEVAQAIALEPLEAKHYFNRGTIYLNLGRLDEAFADFSQSLQLKPSAAALQNRGIVYCRLKQFEPAIADFDDALRRDPNLLLAWRNRALSHFYLQHFELARRDIQEFRARGGTPDEDLLIVEDYLSRL